MAILKVARLGHPILRSKAEPILPAEISSPAVQRLIDDMFATMREYSGIGLAGPQVHEGLRLFVAGVEPGEIGAVVDEDQRMPFMTLINPRVTLAGAAEEEDWEGCLSIPDIRGRVPRAHEVRVEAFDRRGQRLEFAARGFPARVIQHETDHLDGLLFLDRMASFDSLTYLDEFDRFHEEQKDDE